MFLAVCLGRVVASESDSLPRLVPLNPCGLGREDFVPETQFDDMDDCTVGTPLVGDDRGQDSVSVTTTTTTTWTWVSTY